MAVKFLITVSASISLFISCTKDEVADQKTFIRFYGIGNNSQGCDIKQLPGDDGYIIYGTCTTSDSAKDLFITRVDKYGNEIWKANYGSSKNEVAYCMQQLSGNGYLLLGTRDSVISANPNSTGIYLVKTNAEGNSIEWSTIIKVDTASLTGYDIQAISSGGFLITGKASTNSGEKYAFIIFTDNRGNVTKQVYSNFYNLEVKRAKEIDNESGYLLAGTIYSRSSGASDILILAVDKNGNIFNLQNIKSPDADEGKDLRKLPDGSFLILGSEGNSKIHLEKFTIKGEEYKAIWDKSIAVENENYQPSCLELLTDSSFLISGTINNNEIFILKISNNGEVLSPAKRVTANGSQTCSKILKTNDGNIAILGTNEFSGFKEIMLIKVDSNGDF